MRVTVLICTHNRAALLKRVLASLNSARRPHRGQVDILVIANACNDTTHALLNEYQRQRDTNNWLPMAWFAEPTPGKSHALNSAMPRITSDMVAFVDDDHRIHDDYLTEVFRSAESYPQVDVFCGRILPDWDGSEPAWVHNQGPYRIYPLPVPRFDLGDEPRAVTPDIAVPGGGNLFLRTPWLQRTGNFSTDMGPTGHDLGGAEDMEWVLRAVRLGARLQYAPDVVQYHYVDSARLTLPYLMKKAYKRTASTICIDPTRNRRGVPKYLYRKVAEYGVKACTAFSHDRRRFYLVRTAAALGEISGYLQRRPL
jgi:cellulose synthase/poly-beta-1,6-N-acetylglucosamine synthase-like glycosyltransferase